MTATADLLYEIVWNDDIKAFEYRLTPGQKVEWKGQDNESTS